MCKKSQTLLPRASTYHHRGNYATIQLFVLAWPAIMLLYLLTYCPYVGDWSDAFLRDPQQGLHPEIRICTHICIYIYIYIYTYLYMYTYTHMQTPTEMLQSPASTMQNRATVVIGVSCFEGTERSMIIKPCILPLLCNS